MREKRSNMSRRSFIRSNVWERVLLLVLILVVSRVILKGIHTDSQPNLVSGNASLRLVLFTCERYSSFLRLFASIENSLPSSLPVSVTIVVDSPQQGQESADRKRLLNFLRNIESKHGPVGVTHRKTHVGLKRNVLDGWHPIEGQNEYAIFLEDDVEVSPLFLHLASSYVASLHPLPEHVIGISLFNDRVSQQTGAPISAPPNCSFRLYQQAQSWGAILSGPGWLEFLTYFDALDQDFDPIISQERYLSNKWSCESSWKKYLLYYMYHHDKFMVYPFFPDNKSITTHHVEVSEHFPKRPSLKRLNDELRPKLLEVEDLPGMHLDPSIIRMPVYDMSHKPLTRMVQNKAGVGIG